MKLFLRLAQRTALQLVGFSALFSVTGLSLATPSGLNNIPTADTAGEGEYVFQLFTNFGRDRNSDTNLGVKTGVTVAGQTFELGLDGRVTPDKGGPAVGQIKYATDVWQNGKIALGVANIGFRAQDRDRVGNPFRYAVLTQKVGENLRLHGGYGFQTDNDSLLFGVDYTINAWNREFLLRSDLVEIDDGDQFLSSFGFLVKLNSRLVLETWASRPVEDGRTVGTVKLNLVF